MTHAVYKLDRFFPWATRVWRHLHRYIYTFTARTCDTDIYVYLDRYMPIRSIFISMYRTLSHRRRRCTWPALALSCLRLSVVWRFSVVGVVDFLTVTAANRARESLNSILHIAIAVSDLNLSVFFLYKTVVKYILLIFVKYFFFFYKLKITFSSSSAHRCSKDTFERKSDVSIFWPSLSFFSSRFFPFKICESRCFPFFFFLHICVVVEFSHGTFLTFVKFFLNIIFTQIHVFSSYWFSVVVYYFLLLTIVYEWNGSGIFVRNSMFSSLLGRILYFVVRWTTACIYL